ncbi:MAG: hypothetical protein MHPSP_001646 [Paramarteilia canceri]
MRNFVHTNRNNTEPAIEIMNLCKSYGDKEILKSLNMVVPKGKISILLGNNGCGKSTLMNCILGYTGINSGDITIRYSDSTIGDKINEPVSYAPQYDTIYPKLNLRHHITFFGRLKGLSPKIIENKIKEIEKLIGQKEITHKSLGSYSGGMKRKVTLFIAFLGNPSTIILDEPTSSIDPVARQQIWQLINSKASFEKTIIICTHTPKEADILGNYYFIIDEGNIKVSGTRKELITETGMKPKLLLFMEKRYCPQYPAFLPNLTVRNHFKVIYGIRGIFSNKNQNIMINKCLEDFDCAAISDKYPNNLSGGERKRFALAMAHPSLVKAPFIFMFDEAIAALDISTQEMVRKYMQRIVNDFGRCLIFSTH